MPKAPDREPGSPGPSKSGASGLLSTTSRPPGGRDTAGASMVPSMAVTNLPTEVPSVASLTLGTTVMPSMMLSTTSRPPGARSPVEAPMAPSMVPSVVPSIAATDLPTEAPSIASTALATAMPSTMLSTTSRPPGQRGKAGPSDVPTAVPSVASPPETPTAAPASLATSSRPPGQRDTTQPSAVPTALPTVIPPAPSAATPRETADPAASTPLVSLYTDPADVAAATRQTRYATLSAEEQSAQDSWVQSKVREMAPCPVGYAWGRDPEGCPGYRCHGTRHYISDMSFAEGRPALYYWDWEREREERKQERNDRRRRGTYGFPGAQGNQNPPRQIPRGFVGPLWPEGWDDTLGRWVWPPHPVRFPGWIRDTINRFGR